MHQSMEFSRQENPGVDCDAILQRIVPIQGSNLDLLNVSYTLAGRFFTTSPTWEAPGSSLLLGKQVWIPTFPSQAHLPKGRETENKKEALLLCILSCHCYTLRSENTTPAKAHLQTSPLSWHMGTRTRKFQQLLSTNPSQFFSIWIMTLSRDRNLTETICLTVWNENQEWSFLFRASNAQLRSSWLFKKKRKGSF